MHNVVISGASITDDIAWPTWKTFTENRYVISCRNMSAKGIGNKTILIRAFYECLKADNPFPVVMLTNMDKWDWYVPNEDAKYKFIGEKHTITPLNDNDNLGVWATGSWFPLDKEEYKSTFYNQDYHTLENIIMIQWFKTQCEGRGWPYLILFDSPIFEYFEQELNVASHDTLRCGYNKLTSSPIVKPIFDSLDISEIYVPGLIGYAEENHLPWRSEKIKAHPGSLVHYLYAVEHVFPKLDKFFDVKVDNQLENAKVMQKLWNKTS